MIVMSQTAPRRHAISTYDFEWRTHEYKSRKRSEVATLGLICAGAFDERGYRAYSNLEEFLAGELTTENSGRRFYAHFGGASDMVFLIRALAKREYEIKAIFSGSSAIVVIVRDDVGRSWMFLDSYWTMRVPLAVIGDWIGDAKQAFDVRAEHSLAEWHDYNRQDCRLLWLALCRFQDTINDRGAELRVTGASTALDLFLRRYLKKPIHNSERVDAYVKPSYCSSRVERIEETMGNGYCWDINSSFPYSMTFPCPGSMLGASTRIPDKGLWVADVEVSVPHQWLPPLPYRGDDNRVFFPVGKWRTRITSEDLACGDFQIGKVYSCWTFEERDDLAAFASDLYSLRALGGFEGQTFKIVLNSLYGKFAEQPEKESILIRPSKVPLHAQAIAPHIYMVEETKEVPHSHVAISSLITARSRRILRKRALDAYQRSGFVAYLDTDSVFTTATFEESKQLGGMKLEATIVKGEFHAAKFYTYQKQGGSELVKAKGFSRVVSEAGGEQRLTYDDFCRLKNGEEMTVTRMRRIRELVREHKGFDFEPEVVKMVKRLRNPMPKRKPQNSGSSVPWEVGELCE